MVSDASIEIRQAIIDRTREARDATGLSQEAIAKLLGMSQGRYKNYETDRPLPHEYVERFCIATRIDIAWLYTGTVPTARPRPRRTATKRQPAAPKKRAAS